MKSDGTGQLMDILDDYYESIEVIKPKHQRKAQQPKKDKPKRKTYHVVPHTIHHGKKRLWKVKLAGRSTVANGVFNKKTDAVTRAKELGKKAKLGQVIIHKLDGTIQTEYTYGEDPRKTKG
jgi:hypothetical protein